MSFRFKPNPDAATVPIVPVTPGEFPDWCKIQPDNVRNWVESTGFKGQAGRISLMAGGDGGLERVFLGIGDDAGIWVYAGLPGTLPPGTYHIEAELEPEDATGAALGWALACYRFSRYQKSEANDFPVLVWPAGCDRSHVRRAADATFLVRDLINTPAGDMGPAELAEAARKLADAHGAKASVTTGDALLKHNYPTIHAVGRASASEPRLIDITWGRDDAPRVALVGKGVCFDSGGLDLKPASGMLRMKKDMGGGATVLGLAAMIMAAKLDVRLRVLVPAVENSVSGNALRPLDIIRTRKGTTVEIGNTDAEGRLVMCDALAEAAGESPALMIDCATLTGAARIALGPDLPAMFCNDDALAADALASGKDVGDPLWRLPLWQPYRRLLDSKVADINNVSEGGQGGAITAALYLQEFVPDEIPWIHLDIMAWNTTAKPGRPVGGEAMGMRAMFELIRRRFA